MPRRGSGSPYGHTWRKVRAVVLDRDGWMCQVRGPGCTGSATEVDHVVPISAGGSLYAAYNLRASCRHCNRGRYMRDEKRKRDLEKAKDGASGYPGPSRDW